MFDPQTGRVTQESQMHAHPRQPQNSNTTTSSIAETYSDVFAKVFGGGGILISSIYYSFPSCSEDESERKDDHQGHPR